VHLLFLFSLAGTCLGQSATCTEATCSFSATLPEDVAGHGTGWSFPDQESDDNRQVVWAFEIDDGDFLINWSNAYSFTFQATVLGPDGITSTTFTMGANPQITTTGTQWIPGAENWLGQTIRITLSYTRPIVLRRLKLERSSSLIPRYQQAACTICPIQGRV
jgi:hypothetical protein